MLVKELIEELKKYDGDLKVDIYKVPVRNKICNRYNIKKIVPIVDGVEYKITGVNIGF